MKRLLLTFVAAPALLLGGCIIVVDEGEAQVRTAGNRMVGGDMTVTLDERGDFSIAGGDIEVTGDVDGTLSISGADILAHRISLGGFEANAADVRFQGSVSGDAELNAADIEWTGAVGGAAHFNAADLEFEGSVGEGLRANIADGRFTGLFAGVRINSADLHFDENAQVRGSLYANAADFVFHGTLEGGLDLAVNHAVIAGTIAGPVMIEADPGRAPHGREDGLVEISGTVSGGEICARRVVISGIVSGPLAVTADEPAVIEAGADAASVSYTPRNGQRCERE
ncbi:hypothetical protein E5163_13395 [Marinicauda algicola]|uniref:Polymer-forming cytoskeletal protein n=1 Tax=Marinicauda algicola TaxID=2029849 RepID=A0A4S2GXU6_9PROT|nr:hypothetical protein [Marinicauda algicola]TGY87906.1 hypothetical protein E5163_13395 [Marinicauda algicola]